MRILADTNVMIDYMKRPSEKMIEVFQNEDIIISGVVETRYRLPMWSTYRQLNMHI